MLFQDYYDYLKNKINMTNKEIQNESGRKN